MKKILLCTLLLFPITCQAQTQIKNILENRERHTTFRSKIPICVELRYTSISGSGDRYNATSVTYYDKAGMPIRTESNIVNKIAKTTIDFTNDTLNRIVLSSQSIVQHPLFSEITKRQYQYNKANCLISVTVLNAQGQLIERCEIENNQFGDPFMISSYDKDGNLYGREIATYDYDANKVTCTIFDARSKLVSKHTKWISNRQRKDVRYNDRGDLIYSPITDNSYNEYVNKYDPYGNILEQKTFLATIQGKGKTNKNLIRIYKYKYIYE